MSSTAKNLSNPWAIEHESSSWEVDVDIGRKQSNQANNSFQQGFAIEPQPPLGRRRIQIPEIIFHPKQPSPILITTRLVLTCFITP